jgi:hypothetical protein
VADCLPLAPRSGPYGLGFRTETITEWATTVHNCTDWIERHGDWSVTEVAEGELELSFSAESWDVTVDSGEPHVSRDGDW